VRSSWQGSFRSKCPSRTQCIWLYAAEKSWFLGNRYRGAISRSKRRRAPGGGGKEPSLEEPTTRAVEDVTGLGELPAAALAGSSGSG
jgi:hypothetical protein